MSVLTLKIPEALERALDRVAAARGVGKSLLVREAIASYITQSSHKDQSFVSALDLAGDLVGSIRTCPPRLATDPKFMEDFGRD